MQANAFCVHGCFNAYSTNIESMYICLIYCLHKHNLTCVHLTFCFFHFLCFICNNSRVGFFFCIVKTLHTNFSQIRSQLLQDYIAQDVPHQCPTIFFYSTMNLLISFRGVLEHIDCLYLFTFPHRWYLKCSLHRRGRKFLLAMLD